MGETMPRPTTQSPERIDSPLHSLRPILVAAAALMGVALLGALAARAGAERGPETPLAPASSPAILELTSQPASIRVGDLVTVELCGRDLPVFGGVGLYLAFDSARLQAVEVTPGVHIVAGDLLTPAFREQENQVDNGRGLISYAASRSAPPYPSGNGCLIRFAFQARAAGEASVSILSPDTAIVSPDGTLREYAATDLTLTVRPTVTCTERVRNGGFESPSFDPWSSAGCTQIDLQQAHTGTASAWFGGHNYGPDCPEDRLWQPVAIGQGAESATLSYWIRIQTEEAGAATDRLVVELLDGAGAPLVQHLWTDLEAGEWRQSPAAELDLAPYAGQTLRLVLRSEGDAARVTSFHVDDISLRVCGLDDQPPHPWRVFLPLALK